MKLNR